MTNSEDNLFNNKEEENMEMGHLVSEENVYDQNDNGQQPEFDTFGTALNEL